VEGKRVLRFTDFATGGRVSLRILMFGWEFPPYQAGGLATATQGLVKGMLRRGLG
jgi:hypothetical protein